MNSLEIIATYVVGPVLTALIAYLIGKRKTNAEAKKNELENVEGAIKIWREMAEAMTGKLDQRDATISEQNVKLDKLLTQNTHLLNKVNALERDYNKLQKNYEALKQEIESK